MKKLLIRLALSAGLFVSATAAKATQHPLSTPPPSIYLDTESSVTVPLTGWNDLTRVFKVRFELGEATSSFSSGEATSSSLQNGNVSNSIRSDGDVASPTNCCVQVALGTDANADGNLEPHETDLVLGYDCGEWFVRDERFVEQASSPAPGEATSSSLQNRNVSISIRSDGDVASPSATFTIPRQLFDRTWNAAKVTTRGAHGVSALPSPFANTSITLILKNNPFVIRIR